MSGIDGVGSIGPATGGTEQAPALRLKAEDFFQLLAAQLRYQNPLEPLDNVQFMTQLTQFAVLQELVDLKAQIDQAKEDLQKLQQTVMQEEKLGRALGLVGLEVAVRAEDGSLREGLVTGVRLVAGEPYLLLGEETVALENLIEVRRPAVAPEEPGSSGGSETEAVSS